MQDFAVSPVPDQRRAGLILGKRSMSCLAKARISPSVARNRAKSRGRTRQEWNYTQSSWRGAHLEQSDSVLFERRRSCSPLLLEHRAIVPLSQTSAAAGTKPWCKDRSSPSPFRARDGEYASPSASRLDVSLPLRKFYALGAGFRARSFGFTPTRVNARNVGRIACNQCFTNDRHCLHPPHDRSPRMRPDLVAFVESIYQVEHDDPSWMGGILYALGVGQSTVRVLLARGKRSSDLSSRRRWRRTSCR